MKTSLYVMYVYVYVYVLVIFVLRCYSMISLCFSYSTELPAVCSQAQLSRKTQLPPAESKPNTDDVLFLDVGWENSQVILLPYFTKCSKLLQDDSRSKNLRLARVDTVHKYHRFTSFYNVLHIYIVRLEFFFTVVRCVQN